VLPSGGSKAEGIKQLIQLLHIDLEDTIAFGDYLNDLEMLAYVGHGVAMGNAPEIVKQAARHITRDVGQDGIKYGLRLLGLLGKEPQEIV
jgi:hydroxymethylpyrimidine pyrophosphatase-like HAD family hydrolase